jgi:protein-S-isoprenylcysteine O-methyltransferase Ste14
MEVLPTILKAQGLHEERRVRVGSGKVVKTRSIVDGIVRDERMEDAPRTQQEDEYTKLGVKAIVGIVALMWWMLLMTAAFFHTWFEKFTGFVVAFVGVVLIYFLPRGIPQLRAVVGMPGL